MKKRVFVLALAVLFLMASLLGCGKKEEEEKHSKSNSKKIEEKIEKKLEKVEEIEEPQEIEEVEEVEEEGLVDRRTDIQKYWNGDWYGWVSILAKDAYKELNDTTYDACGRIEVDENGEGTLTLWYGMDDGDTYYAPTGVVKIHIDDTIGSGSHGAMISTGGWMFLEDNPKSQVEEGEIYVKPDEEYSLDCLYINYEYKDENGSVSPLFALRPWGYTWEDDSAYDKLDNTMPGFFKWYTKLIDGGWALPDDFDSTPTKTMEEREIELIELAQNQDTPIRTDSTPIASSSDSGNVDDTDDTDTYEAYYNDSTDFENESGSSRITHGFEKEIKNPKITGKSYSWGKLQVNIPDGMEAKNGGIANKDDENSLQVVKGTKYFIISQRYELDALDDVITTTNTNDADEISVFVNGVEWEGAYYEYSGSPVWQIYSTDEEEACIEIMGYGFDFDSEEAQTILATAKSTSPIWE